MTPSATGPAPRPAARRSSWACAARTVPARCSPPATAAPASSARWPRCCRSRPATSRPSPPRSVRPPTRSPSTPSRPPSTRCAARRTTPAGPGCSSARRPTGRAVRLALPLPDGARWARDLVDAAPSACARRSTAARRRRRRRWHRGGARRWPGARPDLTAVTRDGDVLAPGCRARRLGASAPSLLEVQAAVDEARHGLEDAARRGEQARRGPAPRRRSAAASAAEQVDGPWRGCTSPTPGWRPSPSGWASSARRRARRPAEAERPEQAVVAAERALVSDRGRSPSWSSGWTTPRRAGRGGALHRRARPARPGRDGRPGGRDRGAAGAAHRRGAGPRDGRRAEALESAARSESAARERAAARRERRRREAAVAEAVRRGADHAAGRVAPRWSWPARRGRRRSRPAPSVRRPWPASAARSAPSATSCAS